MDSQQYQRYNRYLMLFHRNISEKDNVSEIKSTFFK